MAIDANYRSVRRETFWFTTNGDICNHCARQEAGCKVKWALDDEFVTVSRAKRCADFVPVLGFKQPLLGFENERFSTFRLGEAWHKRLYKGALVGLFNKDKSKLFGYAEVEKLELDGLKNACERFARFNHSQLHLDDLNAPQRMYARLSRLYGPSLATENKPTTVIFLRKLNEAEVEKRSQYYGLQNT